MSPPPYILWICRRTSLCFLHIRNFAYISRTLSYTPYVCTTKLCTNSWHPKADTQHNRGIILEYNNLFGILLYIFLFLPRETLLWHYLMLFDIVLHLMKFLQRYNANILRIKQHEGDDNASARLILRVMLRLKLRAKRLSR